MINVARRFDCLREQITLCPPCTSEQGRVVTLVEGLDILEVTKPRRLAFRWSLGEARDAFVRERSERCREGQAIFVCEAIQRRRVVFFVRLCQLAQLVQVFRIDTLRADFDLASQARHRLVITLDRPERGFL